MQPGTMIRVCAYRDKELERRVVSLKAGVVFVCRDDEYLAAQKQGREPICIGFNLADVVVENVRKDRDDSYGRR